MKWFRKSPVIPVLRLNGPIGMVTPLKPGLSLETLADPIEKAFTMSAQPAVVVVVNSPGGSPVQSSLILKRIRQWAVEKDKKVYVFCEDVAASGGYYIALAGDEIYADASSIIGSIGVISAGFGFVDAIEKLGIDRRVYTSGESKNILDPFKPEKEEDVARLQALQKDVHEVFKGVVKERRASRLKGNEDELFSGAFWSAAKSIDLGLIDGIGEVREVIRQKFGDKVRLKVVPLSKPGLLSWLKRLPSFRASRNGGAPSLRPSFSDEILSTLEARGLWSRFGL